MKQFVSTSWITVTFGRVDLKQKNVIVDSMGAA